MSKVQEETRQTEQMVKIKEYEAHIEQMKLDQKRVEGEQRRKTIEEEAKHNRHVTHVQWIRIVNKQLIFFNIVNKLSSHTKSIQFLRLSNFKVRPSSKV